MVCFINVRIIKLLCVIAVLFTFIMWKGKGAQQRTVNLCNQFLVIYLSKKKNQLEKIGMDRKAMVYHTAISSIKKYPLPIICMEQLKSLYGIGELVSEQLLKVIKAHYKSFLRDIPQPTTNSNLLQNNNENLEEEQAIRQVSCSKSIDQSDFRKDRKKQQSQKVVEHDQDSQRAYSCKSVNNSKPYKPRPNTQSAYVLLILWKMNQRDFISRDRVIEQLKISYNVKITSKSFVLLLSNLDKSGYLEIDSQDYSFIRLTTKGLKEAQSLQIKTKQKQSCLKVKSRLAEFKQSRSVRPQPKSVVDKPKQHLVYYKVAGQLVLLIDSREIIEKQDQSFFEKRLREKYNIKCRTCNLPIGDFMWEYQGQVLDYVVERKKADDLISSIHDGRYKEQKYRLKNSSFSNIFYLLEGHLSSNFAKFQREVEGAILTTRVKDGFRVVSVNNIQESTKFISYITEQLNKKLLQEKAMISLGTIEDVINSNGKASQLTIENIFGLSLKTIPGIGKVAVNEVLKHFKCFRQLHEALSKLENRFEKVQFLRELLRGCGVRSTLPELLVDVIFGEQNKLI